MAPPRAFSRRQILGAAALMPAAMTLGACDPAAFGTATRGGAPGPVTVGLLVPSNAADPQLGLIADSLTKAARLAVSEAEPGMVTLRTYSTAADPGRAQQAAQQAKAEGANIILGPLLAQNAAAVGTLMAQSNTAVLTFSNNTDIAGRNVLMLGDTFENRAAELGAYAASQGKRRVFIINARSAAEQVIRDAAVRGLSGTGVSVVGSGEFDLSQEGLVAALPGIAAAARGAGADALLLTSDTQAALPTLVGLLPDYGLPASQFQYMCMARADIPPSATSLPGLQGCWFTMPDTTPVGEFNRRYIAANGNSPHLLAPLAYDGIRAIAAQASRSGPAGLSPQALINAGAFSGATGTFRFLSDGTNRRSLAVATIRSNTVSILKQASSRLGATGS
ncbi:ABC transporter substrate-binding protein [Mangrovicoccus algicola]|uniref:ABC transporter substrate-binding protein n=1 Tax=Mangrovicoccus algicola TaxID=2771008 RepID=UPI001D017AD8|nr:ABC transporter substrate-binding protein [Mangrovicoccus algicola]